MTIDKTELDSIGNRLIEKHGKLLVDLVTMCDFYKHATAHIGPLSVANYQVLLQAVMATTAANGIKPSQVRACINDLQQSRETVSYLQSLPD